MNREGRMPNIVENKTLAEKKVIYAYVASFFFSSSEKLGSNQTKFLKSLKKLKITVFVNSKYFNI